MIHPYFSMTILRWFEAHGRVLPWRQTHDPYAIWLSEIILQQTRIEQGRPYWERFMQRWPSVEKLAAASEDDVLREWQGLGYYSRARNLHKAARQIVELGRFPDTFETIKRLKGVGDYTAAAVGSIAFDLPVAVVDGNVYRVLAHHFGISTPINSTEGKKEFAALAQALLPPDKASAYNQGMMDFGAMQCTPAADCAGCPLQESCVAYRENRVGELPVKLRTVKVSERRLVYVYIRSAGFTAIRRRSAGDIWQGLWEPANVSAFPELELLLGKARLVRKDVKHVLTHRIIYADFYLLETDERPLLPSDYIWIREEEMDGYGIPRLIQLFLESL